MPVFIPGQNQPDLLGTVMQFKQLQQGQQRLGLLQQEAKQQTEDIERKKKTDKINFIIQTLPLMDEMGMPHVTVPADPNEMVREVIDINKFIQDNPNSDPRPVIYQWSKKYVGVPEMEKHRDLLFKEWQTGKANLADQYLSLLQGSGGIRPEQQGQLLETFARSGGTPELRSAAMKRLEEMAKLRETQAKGQKDEKTANLQFIGLDTESQKPILFNPKTGGTALGELPSGAKGIAPKITKPLPTVAQDNLTASQNAWRTLKTMEDALGQTGLIKGWVSRGQAKLGYNEAARNFLAAERQFTLFAQSLIKGVPSNYDISVLVRTLPSLTEQPETNKSRIDASRAMIKTALQDTLAYFKGVGYQIPKNTLSFAKSVGIDPNSITPWDGEGDPLQNTMNATTEKSGKQLDATTAQKFLQEAGGDKNKARELAKQAGYSF